MGSASGSLSRRSLCAGAISLLPAAAALLSAPLLSGCANTPATRQSSDAGSEPSTGSTFAFDTYCTFTVYGDDSAPALLAKECARYDKLFNLYDESSDIARVNAAQGAAVTVDPATLDLLEQALAFCASAQGLFDITIGAVSTLWDFSEGVRPSDADIANALPHVNWRCVEPDAEQATVRLADPEGIRCRPPLRADRTRDARHRGGPLPGRQHRALWGEAQRRALGNGHPRPQRPRRRLRGGNRARGRRLAGDQRPVRADVRAGRRYVLACRPTW